MEGNHYKSKCKVIKIALEIARRATMDNDTDTLYDLDSIADVFWDLISHSCLKNQKALCKAQELVLL